MATKGNGAALALRESYALALNQDMDRLGEILGPGENFDIGLLPMVKVPAGGGVNWELPNGDAAKRLEGVLILRHPVRAYWRAGIDDAGGGQPPDCSSSDGIAGTGSPGGECSSCPMNEWGSRDGSRGKACRQITRMYILEPGKRLPLLFPAPPSAFRDAQGYELALYIEDLEPTDVVTRISLAPASNQDGVKYSRPVFERAGTLDSETAEAMRAYRKQLEPVLMSVGVGAVDSAG